MHSRLHVSPIQNPKLKTYVEIIISENQTQAWKTPHFLHKVTARREEPGLPEEVGAAGRVRPSEGAPSPGDLHPSSRPKARAHGSSVVNFDGHTPFDKRLLAVGEQRITSDREKKALFFSKKYLPVQRKKRLVFQELTVRRVASGGRRVAPPVTGPPSLVLVSVPSVTESEATP